MGKGNITTELKPRRWYKEPARANYSPKALARACPKEGSIRESSTISSDSSFRVQKSCD